MRKTFITLPLVISAAVMPAFAGTDANVVRAAQGLQVAQLDARSATPAQRSMGTNAELASSAPRQKTRAEVHAEAVAWTKSGMSEMAYGDVPFDSRGPSYDRAVQAFQKLNQDTARNGK